VGTLRWRVKAACAAVEPAAHYGARQYANYDDEPSFADFRPFGGWTKPAFKQYHGTTTICGAGIDKNWYPN
jgi:hypothetical protein